MDPNQNPMKEEFLHYLWKYQLYNNHEHLIVDGKTVEVMHPGEHNTDSGPDFFNAKIKIGETIWAGNVEVHVKASDWKKHNHQHDKAYDNVVLHVVAENDYSVQRSSGEQIPTLSVRGDESMLEQYNYLMKNKAWVPCETFINKIDSFIFLQWKERLLVERLQEKSLVINHRYQQCNNNFEEVFYQTLAANMGFKTNAQPFEHLAKNLPIAYLAKHKDELPMLEAMLLGQAGLIPKESKDAYVIQLQKNYKHLKAKFGLHPMDDHWWKFMRMRPANFPTLRIIQFAALIYQSSSLFSKVLEAKTLGDLQKLFEVKVSKFWETHYTFNKSSEEKAKQLGKQAFGNIVINTVAPTLFFYGKIKGRPEYYQKAMDLLLELKPENNSIVRAWKSMGLDVERAFDSQALIQLKNVYCKNRKCLNCSIGDQVLKFKA